MTEKTSQDVFPFTEYGTCSIFRIDRSEEGRAVDVGKLREILLTGLEGVAIRAFALSVAVEGKPEDDGKRSRITKKASHVYDALDHVREDMSLVKRSLQEIVIDTPKFLPERNLETYYEIVFDGKEREMEVTCKLLSDENPDITFVPNHDHVLTLVKEPEQTITLKLWLFLDARKGFVKAEQNWKKKRDSEIEKRIGQRLIPIDAKHSPVVRCAIHCNEEDDYTLMEIETNGSVTPWKALKRAYEKLIA